MSLYTNAQVTRRLQSTSLKLRDKKKKKKIFERKTTKSILVGHDPSLTTLHYFPWRNYSYNDSSK